MTRLRQEKESIEKDYYRVENALRMVSTDTWFIEKNNDTLLATQQQLNDAVTRRNTLIQMVDDSKKEIRLLEGQVSSLSDKMAKLQLENQVLFRVVF